MADHSRAAALCLAALLVSVAGADAQTAAPSAFALDEGNWHVSQHPSTSGGPPQVAAVLQSVQGTSALVVRCHDRITDVYLTLPLFVGGPAESLPVSYAINDGPATETRWMPSREGNAVFVPSSQNAIAFLRSLPDDGTVAVTIRDYQSRSSAVTLALGPIGEVRDAISSACNWPAEQRVATIASPPPAAPPSATPAPARKAKVVMVAPHQQRWSVNAQRR